MVRTRFAPSPTGSPHVGSAYAALFNYVFAKQKKGKFILRIEDTDRKRYVPEAEAELLESLKWLGLYWDEGPIHQSERLEIYKKYAQELVKRGVAYEDGGAIRQKVPKEGETKFVDLVRGEISFKNKNLDESVLLKSDGFPTYHLGVVVDDHLMEITHIIRGEEWIPSTPKHILLYRAFGWELPKFAHLPLLRDPKRAKLGKRFGDVSLKWFRDGGFLPETLLNYLALLGWSHPEEKEIFDLAEMIKVFSLERISTSAPVFDLRKLEWMNGIYIRSLSVSELGSKLKAQSSKLYEVDGDYLQRIVPLVQERMRKLSEFESLTEFFFEEPQVDPKLLVQKDRTDDETAQVLSTINNQLSTINNSDWRAAKLEKLARDFTAKLPNWQTGKLFMTLRVALTGRKVSPPLFETMEVLGKEKVLSRLDKAKESLS